MGSIVKSGMKAVSGIFGGGGSSAPAGQAKLDEAHALKSSALNALRAVGVPEVEAQQIILQSPELFIPSESERISGTALDNVTQDPRLQSQIMDALGELQTRGEEGLTTEDKARFEALREVGASDEQARQASILQSMAQRGSLDSGAQLAAQLASSQGQAQRAAQQGREIASASSQARRDALSKAANIASQLSGQDIARQTQLAQAQDQIARFNAGVSQRETAARQSQANQIAALRNQQEMSNKALIQQKFQNELSKASGAANQLNVMGQGAQAAAASQAAAGQKKKSAMGSMLGGLGTIGGGIAGSYFGPIGGMVGASAGGALGQGLGSMFGADGGYKSMNYQDGGVGPNIAQALAKRQEDIYAKQSMDKAKLDNILSRILSKSTQDIQQPLQMTNPEQQDKASSGIPVGEIVNALAQSGIGGALGGTAGGSLAPLMQSGAAGSGALTMSAAEGGYKHMGYEEGGLVDDSMVEDEEFQTDGRIVPEDEMMELEENFEGDNIPDRINAGESVNNLDMQQRNVELLRELQELRADKAVAQGLATVNEQPQKELIDVLRGDKGLEQADLSQDVVEPTEKGKNKLLELLQQR